MKRGVASPLPPILMRLGVLSIGAPRRGAHFGLVDNSSHPVRLVALSRLVRSNDEATLAAVTTSAVGVALLTALRRITLRVALASGRADPTLSETQVDTFFNSPASTVHTKRLYDQQLSLPSKLPQPQAKALLEALLEAIGAAHASPAGARVVELMMGRLSLAASDATTVDTMAASIDEMMMARLGSAPTLPLPVPAPPPPSPLAPAPPTASASAALDPAVSLTTNFVRHLAVRWGRPLSSDENHTVDAALDEGLMLMQAGDAATRRRLLDGSVLAALSNAPAAQLWACCLEVGERDLMSASDVAEALVSACSTVTAVLFVDALAVGL